jgi:tRNA(fMet)-specific endonuclease VapC
LAEHHAALLAYTARKGQRRGPHDLIVAATGRATLTTDVQARFGELPDVNGRIVT